MRRRQEKRIFSHDEIDWQGCRKMSDDAYEQARITGNMQFIMSHDILHDGDLEIEFAMDLARVYLQMTPRRGKALDVACGCGYMTACLMRAGFDAMGFDISSEAIALAKTKYPHITFFIGDGAKPGEIFNALRFDLIHIREFHPFTRVDDFDWQIQIIEKYLGMLADGGFLFINQSRRGDCGNLAIKRVRQYAVEEGMKTAGPLYFFPHKHLRIPPRFKTLNRILWLFTKAYAVARRRYPIEFFLIHRPQAAHAS